MPVPKEIKHYGLVQIVFEQLMIMLVDAGSDLINNITQNL